MRARFWPATFWLLILFAATGFSAGTNSSSNFAEANRLYEQGKYTEAISKYEAEVRSGQLSSALLFNLGNAYFKNGELGRAIYNYRRARALSPRDPDVQANLRFARDTISSSASVQEPGWARGLRYFRLNELAIASAIAFWIFFALLAAIRYRPAWRQTFKPYISASAALLFLSVVILAAANSVANERVVIASQHQLAVRLGPLRESQPAFTVPDGTELRIENEREGWWQVADRSNRSGWVEQERVLTWP